MAGAPKGNTNATKEKRLITDALKRVVTQNPEKLRKACEKILDDAVDGSLGAFSVISDRLEGKPAQSVTLAGDPDSPIDLRWTMEVVNAKGTDTKEA